MCILTAWRLLSITIRDNILTVVAITSTFSVVSCLLFFFYVKCTLWRALQLHLFCFFCAKYFSNWAFGQTLIKLHFCYELILSLSELKSNRILINAEEKCGKIGRKTSKITTNAILQVVLCVDTICKWFANLFASMTTIGFVLTYNS